MKNKYLAIFLSLIILGCMGKESSYESVSSYKEETKASSLYDEEYSAYEQDGAISSKDKEIIPEKIIKSASISIEIEDYEESIAKIKESVKKWKAYISEEDERNYSYQISNTLIIRVPAKYFDSLIADIIKDVKQVDTKSISSLDVTEEYIDIETRLKTKREYEKRYLKLLAQAKNIEEILKVEEQIRIIREEIEAKQGRLKYLNDRIGYSTITLNIYQYFDDLYKPGFFKKSLEAFEGGWKGLKVFIIGLFYIWPVWVILITGLILLRIYLRKRRAKKK